MVRPNCARRTFRPMLSPQCKPIKTDYYVVLRILEHKIDEDIRSFKIRWFGYDDPSDDTWEPESHLDGCIPMLNNYCERNGLPPTHMIELVGSIDQGADKQNWVSLDKIIQSINVVSNSMAFYNNIDVKILQSVKDFVYGESIYIHSNGFHCFVLAIDKENRLRVADGANLCYSRGNQIILGNRILS